MFRAKAKVFGLSVDKRVEKAEIRNSSKVHN